MNKIYLYKPNSFWGRVITFVTRSPYSHTAVEINGIVYDSSETRGTFAQSDIIPQTREHDVFVFDGDLTVWLWTMKGKKYDWQGVWGYIFGINNKNKFYCFETSYSALMFLEIAKAPMPYKVNGNTVKRVLSYG